MHHWPTGARPIGPDPSWPQSKCSQGDALPKLGFSQLTNCTVILHWVNDEPPIGWLHHWLTGAVPICPDPPWPGFEGAQGRGWAKTGPQRDKPKLQ